MKIAIVHEMLIKLGGAEKVVEVFSKMYPDADIFTLIYDEEKVGKIFPKEKIHPQVFHLGTQKIYNLFKKQRFCLPFMPRSVESLDLSQYDIVIISSSGFAHGVITKPETKTIVYYHAPARYLWDWTNEYKKDIGAQKGIKGYIFQSLFLRLRQWDYIASKRHEYSFANSSTTQKRLWKYFKIPSTILYPPIETKRFQKKLNEKEKEEIFGSIGKEYSISYPEKNLKLLSEILLQGKYYIILSALTEFKKIDIAIQYFKDFGNIHLVVVGKGEYKKRLEEISEKSENIFFLGAQYDDSLVAIVQNSMGLIFPGEEDFGIVPLEVMSAGKPVFALKKGGLTESVIPGVTGDFFESSDGDDFCENFYKFHQKNQAGEYLPQNCRDQAQKFDREIFKNKIQESIIGKEG